jgi:hypothetical protein
MNGERVSISREPVRPEFSRGTWALVSARLRSSVNFLMSWRCDTNCWRRSSSSWRKRCPLVVSLVNSENDVA